MGDRRLAEYAGGGQDGFGVAAAGAGQQAGAGDGLGRIGGFAEHGRNLLPRLPPIRTKSGGMVKGRATDRGPWMRFRAVPMSRTGLRAGAPGA